MDTLTLKEIAGVCETAEAMAWRDMVSAASDQHKRDLGLRCDVIEDNTYITCSAIPFAHFNCMLGFGIKQNVSQLYSMIF